MGRFLFPIAVAAIVLVDGVSRAETFEEPRAEISDERLQAGRPILRPLSDVPQGRIQQLALSEEGGRLRLYAAGDDKLVRKWNLDRNSSGQFEFHPEQPIRWPILSGQTGIIFGLDLHPDFDGRTLLAFGGIGVHPSQVELVDVANPNARQTLKVPEFGKIHQYAYAVAFHPTQPYLVAGLGGNREDRSEAALLVWHWDDGTPRHIASLETELGAVDYLDFNPGGDRLLAADFGGIVTTWAFSADPGNPLRRLEQSDLQTRISGARWTSDRTWIAATETKGLLSNAGVSSSSETKRWTTTRIVNRSGAAIRYRVRENADPKPAWETLPTRTLHAGETFQSDGRTTALDFNLVETNVGYVGLAAGQQHEIRMLEGQPRLINVSGVTAIATSRATQYVAAALANYELSSYGQKPHQVFLQPAEGAPRRRELERAGFEGDVTALAFSPRGDLVAAAGVDTVATDESSSENLSGIVVRVWSTSDGRLLGEFPSQHSVVKSGGAIANAAIVDQSTIAFARGPMSQNLIDPTYYQFLRDRDEPLPQPPELTHRFALNGSDPVQAGTAPAGNSFWIIGYDDQTVSLRQVQGGRTELGPLPHLAAMGNPLSAVDFQIDGRKYVAVGYVSGILVWDVEAVRQGKASRQETLAEAIARGFYGPEGRVTCLAVSEGETDDRWLLAGSDDGTLSAWSLKGLRAEPAQRRELQIRLQTEDGRLSVEDVVSTGPGWLAGFEPGDEILGVELPYRAGSGRETELAPDQWRRALELPIPGFQTVVRVRGRSNDSAPSRDVRIVATRALHQPLWTFYPLVDGNWVLWSPSGYFVTSSESAAQSLGWHKNLGLESFDFFSADVFRDSFEMSPIKRRRLMRYRSPIPPPETIAYPSRVSITKLEYAAGGAVSEDHNVLDSARDLVVSVQGEQRDREHIVGLQIWCNGRLVADAASPGTGTFQNTESTASLNDVVIEKGLLRQGTTNSIIAVVESRLPESELTIRNRSIRPIFVHGSPVPKLHYLGIGVTRLADAAGFRAAGIQPLEFAANDAYYLGQALKRAQSERSATSVFRVLAHSGDLTGPEASPNVTPPTRAAILEALDTLVTSAGADDLACILISAHGFSQRNGVPGLFLVAEDTAANLENAVTREDLYDRLRKLPCASLLLIDACHSGQIESNRELQDVGELPIGPSVLASSSPGQKSWEQPRLRYDPTAQQKIGHGIFTAAALEALTADRLRISNPTDDSVPAADQSGDGRLSLEELTIYVSSRVPHLANALGLENQTPVLIPSSTQRDREIDLRDFAGHDG